MKNNKLKNIALNIFAIALLTTILGAANVFAQRPPAQIKMKSNVDISIRPALYFGNNVLSSQPLNNSSRYVTPGNKIILTPADSFNNEGGLYSFNILYIVYGSPMKNAVALPEFTDRLRIGSEIVNQHTVKFSDKDSDANDTKIQFIRTHLKLPIGTSSIKLSLDDDKKITETNENNNLYTFTVEVVAKP